MTQHSTDETREQRQEITRRALAEVSREHIATRRLRQTKVSLRAGISRSCLRSILAAKKGCSLFVFLELSSGLRVDDACELLPAVLNRRDELRRVLRGGAT